ncbi:FtsB family cell division protein [Nitrosophilus alvini]|uniref:FtsB family cell division protein n=1 Tax=Nitrosophilus alvini TaxID=2714855 RepID=UPI0019091C2F|nr:hypothetical protein [Nitrosophilus alvini]
MREILDDLGSKSFKETFFWFLKIFGAVVAVVLLGLYIGTLLFGKNSVEVLFELQEQEKLLKKEVNRLKQENAKLQKEYFELKQLEPGQ